MSADGTEHKPDYHGHRERLKARFRRGPEALEDYELLELLLFQVLPRVDTKSIAKALLARFGSFADVLAAPEKLLQDEVDGMGPAAAFHLKTFHAAAARFGRPRAKSQPILASWAEVLDYCRTAMAFEEREQFRILFLDKKNRLIKDDVQQVGTVDHTPVYPREVVKRALELSATALVLVHNHPSGDPTPSQADIRMTRTIVDVAQPLGIVVHDHIIVGRDGHASFRGLKLI